MLLTDSDNAEGYERGDALEGICNPQDVLDNSLSTKKGDSAAGTSEIYALTTQEYWEWLAALIQDGTELDDHLDDLLEEVYGLSPSFYSRHDRRRLHSLLERLHELRTSVRAFERDVEQLAFVFSRTDKMEAVAADNAEHVLANVKRTYDRAYDLCLYKLDRISNGWVTATNILISLTILVVTILFWMEFR